VGVNEQTWWYLARASGIVAMALLVPGASSYRPLAVAIGVVSMYLLVAVEATSYLRRRLPARVWHRVHLASYGLVWGAAVHAGLAGTDVTNRVYQAVALLLTIAAVAATVVRVLGVGRASPRRAARSPSASEQDQSIPRSAEASATR
jgi:DMSO/TMAO reductase YedYZ heme-binding membrane subunit